MKLSKLNAAFGLVFSALPIWAQKNVPAGMSLEQLVGEIKISTDSMRVQGLGQMLSEFQPKTEKDVRSLMDAMQDEKTAPYAQMGVSRVAEPDLGPILHEGLKAQKASLRHMSAAEFKALPREAQESAMRNAMNAAAVIQALGTIKHKAAIPDLRELLSYDREYEGYIAWTASRALGEMGDESSLETLTDKAAQGMPITLSGFKVRGIRKIVERAEEIDKTFKDKPKRINDPRGTEIANLRDELSHMGRRNEEVKQGLRELLRHPNKDIAVGASEALVDSLDPADKDITLEMLRHKDNLVRMSGLHSLCQSKTWDKTFMPILIDMMQHDLNIGVRMSAISTIQTLPAWGTAKQDLQEAAPYLKALLKDRDHGIRGEASFALETLTGHCYPYEGMTPFEKQVMEGDPKCRVGVKQNGSRMQKP